MEKDLGTVTDKAAIGSAHSRFQNTLSGQCQRRERRTIGFQGGSREVEILHCAEADLWMAFAREGNRHWNPFGFGDPFGRPPTIVAELNFPYEGVDRRIGGVFLVNREGKEFVAHRGNVGGGRPGIGKEAFLASIPPERMVEVDDAGAMASVVMIGALDSPEILQDVVNFLRLVDRFKSSRTTPHSCWWVNQGRSYRQEREGEYIWAPKTTKLGTTLAHHTAVGRIREGM